MKYNALTRTTAWIISAVELILLIALYCLFIVLDRVPLVGLIALVMIWLLRWILTGRLTVITPLDVPIVGILIMLAVSLYVSPDWSLSLPKIYGTVLGIAIFYALVNAIISIRRVQLAALLLVFLSAGIALVGMVGTDWVNTKLFNLSIIYIHIPRLITGITRSIEGGFQHNVVAGTLILFIPFLVNLVWSRRGFNAADLVTRESAVKVIRRFYRPAIIFSLALVSLTLVMTQSRGAFLGLAVALIALAVWHNRRFLWILPLIAVGGLVLVKFLGFGNVAEFVSGLDSFSGGNTISVRWQIWQRAVHLIRDFPFTGVGIGAFYPVVQALYPFFGISNLVPHAHNIVLTTAVDVGIPGLVLYFTLLCGFGFMAWKAYHLVDRPVRVVIIGLASGMLAHLLFGMMDSFELGTKPGAALWILLALITAIYVHRNKLAGQQIRVPTSAEDSSLRPLISGSMDCTPVKQKILRQAGLYLLVFASWILIFLLSIGIIESQPIWGLSLAVIGGAALGFISTNIFDFIARQRII